jgi:hypothetical protein
MPGKTWDGLGGCFVFINGVETLITSYQVLVQPPLVSDYFTYGWVQRSEMLTNPGLWYLAVQGGFDAGGPDDPDFHICSGALWMNGVYLGTHPGRQNLRPPFDYCLVTWGGQEYWLQDYAILLYAN